MNEWMNKGRKENGFSFPELLPMILLRVDWAQILRLNRIYIFEDYCKPQYEFL